ncbi:MAG TPA: flagellar basal-body rod protein FlgG [Caulifigura sp.]|nr:flagellar basal-body rod protein FlgG [Caulifigura sp.]
MIRALYTSATGMKAQEMLIDVTANNLANVNTSAFKRSMVNFADLIYTTQKPAGTEIASGVQTPTGVQIGTGVRPAGTTKMFMNGTVQQTGNPLDIAIEGDGFFRVELPSGEMRYTRDGSFKMDSQGLLVTADGYRLSGGITIPQGVTSDKINIGTDGTVTGVQGGATNAPLNLGQMIVVKFANPAGLSSEGGNMYAETAASGPEVQGTPGVDGMGTLRQHSLEGSNVEVVSELISLISAQRAYEINSRAIKAGDEMLSTTSEMVR